MKRTLTLLSAVLLALGMMAGPAAAHFVTVDPKGDGEGHVGWVGGEDLPGQGQGLIPGGPQGDWMMTPAHDGGLNTACESLEDNPSVVDIRGPGPNCPHEPPE